MSPLLISIFMAVFSAVLGLVIALIRDLFKRLQDRDSELLKRLHDIEVTLAKLDTQVSPLWARVQAQIASDLHHPDPKYAEMDGLLERLQALTITDFERARLKVLLKERVLDFGPLITDEQRSSAKLMGAVMDKVLAEKASTTPMKLETIAVPDSPGLGEAKGEDSTK